MPTDTKPGKPARAYKVTRGRVGPYPEGHVFSEAEFIDRHRLTGSDEEKRQIDPETYHSDLIGRLLSLGVIEPAPIDTANDIVPVGPENMGQAPGNSAITRATAEAVASQKLRADLAAAQAKETTASVSGQPMAPAAPARK